jgi:hypothetical protein
MYWLRSSSVSANTYGSSCSWQNSPTVHQNGATPAVRAATFGLPVVSPGSGGAKNPTEANGSAGRSSLA